MGQSRVKPENIRVKKEKESHMGTYLEDILSQPQQLDVYKRQGQYYSKCMLLQIDFSIIYN